MNVCKISFFTLTFLLFIHQVIAQVCPLCPDTTSSLGDNLVTNGDFTENVPLDNYVASPGYVLPTWIQGTSMYFDQYTISDTPSLYNAKWCGVDHTNGSTYFLMCDGASGNKTSAWGETIDISSFAPNTDFVFCVWISNSICPEYPYYDDPTLLLRVNHEAVCNGILMEEDPDEWTLISGIWNSGNNPPSSVVIEVVTESMVAVGNDFSIDDISFRACGTCTAANISAGDDLHICPGNTIQLSINNATSAQWTPNVGLSDSNSVNPLAFPESTMTYYLTAIDSSGCQGMDTITIAVSNAEAGPDVIICKGDSSQLSATGGSDYSWLPTTGLSNANISNPEAFPSVTTTYTVTVTDSFGCVLSDDLMVTVAVPIPPSIFIQGNILICSWPNGVQWYLNGNPIPGAQNDTLFATESGVYSVSAVDSNGCLAFSGPTEYLYIGINSISADDDFIVFPNPAPGIFYLQVPSCNATSLRLTLYDYFGKKLMSSFLQEQDPHTFKLDISELPQGIYLGAFEINGQKKFQKLIYQN